MVKNRWYASYWNAFLFREIFAENCMEMKEIESGGARTVRSKLNKFEHVRRAKPCTGEGQG